MRPVELQRYIRTIPDFPRPGILFRDITPLLGNAAAFHAAIDAMAAAAEAVRPGAIVGIESRGFLFGAPLADRLGLPFVPIRKEGKLPAARLTVEYALEYGESRLDIHQDALEPGTAAYIVDDVLATGGTALAAAKLVELLGANVAGAGFLIELAGLGGRERLAGYRVDTLMTFEEA
ncbi:MAG: adenine phosphoribosyltransferase [Tepidiforma sp.]|uniref:adenine phosphoribosyltransferase n=1 Tax=Tepidiforma sp. TaxID=2682230 RepID=UPI0021DC5D28|nr:MAG: adenine phosphoribosyltransferase [Tepidiforma sp.]